MANQKFEIPDDDWFIKLFKDFEKVLSPSKTDIDWNVAEDFQVFKEYLLKDVQGIQKNLKNADDKYLYYVCEHIFNILDWISLMDVAGFSTFNSAWEDVFAENFGDKHILQNIYNLCFEKWFSQKSGQQKVGENYYNILDDKLYYRNRLGDWFEVDRHTAFDIKPKKTVSNDKKIIEQLNREYADTWYDAVLKKWDVQKYQGVLPGDFLQFNKEVTTPEEYFDFTEKHIRELLKNPVSIAELERWAGEEIEDLEDIVKISTLVLNISKRRRSEDNHTIYLLRDSLLFFEAHKTLDILNNKETSSDQLMIGRKLLTHKEKEWGYYVVAIVALYIAHLRFPKNFTDFYHEYARLLDLFESLNPGFAEVVSHLAEYIKEHLKTDKSKVIIFDIGFQGSISLLTKYIIDRHIASSDPNTHLETDLKVGVGALWSKELFGDRHDGDYFPFLNRVQLAARSDELYHYKEGSLESGKLQVRMGSKKWQRKAAIELIVLVIVTLLNEKKDN